MKEIDEKFFKGKLEKRKVEDCLNEGEKIIWRDKPNKVSYFFKETYGVLISLFFWYFFLSLIFASVLTNFKENIIFVIVCIIFFIVPIAMLIFQIVKLNKKAKDTEYVITNKRVLIFKVKIGKIESSIDFKEFSSVTTKQQGMNKIFKVGDVYIKGKKDRIVFFDLKNSEFVYQKLNLILEKKEKAENIYQNEIVCAYCGASYKSGERCPNCGAKEGKE